ncbi:response regulator transcription factor [Hoeflea sp. WL0058]|uniref:Regulatory protein VirG n=1 Tax=Flavimaribacter sediminis TaxID=2865987 RepID=A0AAE2ZMV0_9HYPH|nr:response regulator transcription factor [Flavimaribacter sediminis]MBW8636257.1 response regulator transcription factor [Flavimaribacter sediminis]
MNADSATILLVEDDPEIRRLVSTMMQHEGYRVEVASDGPAMDVVMQGVQPDLVILDLMLPGEDGLSICRRLRTTNTVPILMLTAKSEEVDRVIGLEMGADDYLSKPFGPRELLARVRALLRRAQGVLPMADNRRYAFDRFVVDLDARLLLLSDDRREIDLTSAEFDMLACFILRPRRVLSRDHILDRLHGRQIEPFDRSVDMLVSRLRKKLRAAAPGTDLIRTIRNGGYLLTSPVARVP